MDQVAEGNKSKKIAKYIPKGPCATSDLRTETLAERYAAKTLKEMLFRDPILTKKREKIN